VPDKLVDLGNGFWSIRGQFRVAGVIDIGTQAALVEVAPGRFIMLDSYAPAGTARQEVLNLTRAGSAVEAVFNLHPFHTLHCAATAEMFPAARLYGTARHKRVLPQLAWQARTTDQEAVWAGYADHIEIAVPAGVDLVPQSDRVHFASVLAFHGASATIHVDDTFVAGLIPPPFSWLTGGGLRLHPTLAGALRKEPGAAEAFREWVRDLAGRWSEARQVCAAHRGIVRLRPGEFRQQALAALDRADGTIRKHARRYG
jgi:hypothetical protein